jgi:hypothetical protein
MHAFNRTSTHSFQIEALCAFLLCSVSINPEPITANMTSCMTCIIKQRAVVVITTCSGSTISFVVASLFRLRDGLGHPCQDETLRMIISSELGARRTTLSTLSNELVALHRNKRENSKTAALPSISSLARTTTVRCCDPFKLETAALVLTL